MLVMIDKMHNLPLLQKFSKSTLYFISQGKNYLLMKQHILNYTIKGDSDRNNEFYRNQVYYDITYT